MVPVPEPIDSSCWEWRYVIGWPHIMQAHQNEVLVQHLRPQVDCCAAPAGAAGRLLLDQGAFAPFFIGVFFSALLVLEVSPR